MEIVTHLLAEAELLVSQKRQTEAVEMLERACSNALSLLGMIHYEDADMERAISRFNMSKEIDRTNWRAECNFGHALNGIGMYNEALDAARRAVKFSDGKEFTALYNYGIVLMHHRELDAAEEIFKQALQLMPESDLCAYNIGVMALQKKEFEKGWELYEKRFGAFEGIGKFAVRYVNHRPWDGAENLNGKRVILYIEQGLGDLIMFSRFISVLCERYREAKITLECQSGMKKLIEYSMPKINVVERKHENGKVATDPPEGDFAISICSLPYLLKVHAVKDIPHLPYLYAPPGDVIKIDTDKIRIGFCWAGNADHQLDNYRTIPVGLFREISKIPDIQMYSLQKYVQPIYRKWRSGHCNIMHGLDDVSFIDLVPQINDLADVARVFKSMDLIISVDTSLCHLAGAMNIPVWMPLHYVSDWRWGLNGYTCDWYQSVRIFRKQTIYDSWETVLDQIKSMLVFQPVRRVR